MSHHQGEVKPSPWPLCLETTLGCVSLTQHSVVLLLWHPYLCLFDSCSWGECQRATEASLNRERGSRARTIVVWGLCPSASSILASGPKRKLPSWLSLASGPVWGSFYSSSQAKKTLRTESSKSRGNSIRVLFSEKPFCYHRKSVTCRPGFHLLYSWFFLLGFSHPHARTN